jgi:hypothetical protein
MGGVRLHRRVREICILRNIERHFLTDVSEQLLFPSSRVWDCLTLENGSERMSRNVSVVSVSAVFTARLALFISTYSRLLQVSAVSVRLTAAVFGEEH